MPDSEIRALQQLLKAQYDLKLSCHGRDVLALAGGPGHHRRSMCRLLNRSSRRN
jgi:hypothetical protein